MLRICCKNENSHKSPQRASQGNILRAERRAWHMFGAGAFQHSSGNSIQEPHHRLTKPANTVKPCMGGRGFILPNAAQNCKQAKQASLDPDSACSSSLVDMPHPRCHDCLEGALPLCASSWHLPIGCISITMFATYAPACSGVSGLHNTFRCTQLKLYLGHV